MKSVKNCMFSSYKREKRFWFCKFSIDTFHNWPDWSLNLITGRHFQEHNTHIKDLTKKKGGTLNTVWRSWSQVVNRFPNVKVYSATVNAGTLIFYVANFSSLRTYFGTIWMGDSNRTNVWSKNLKCNSGLRRRFEMSLTSGNIFVALRGSCVILYLYS